MERVREHVFELVVSEGWRTKGLQYASPEASPKSFGRPMSKRRFVANNLRDTERISGVDRPPDGLAGNTTTPVTTLHDVRSWSVAAGANGV